MELPSDNTNLFSEQIRVLRAALRDAPTEQSWERCEAAWSQAVTLGAEDVRLPPTSSSRNSRPVNPDNADDIQRLYRRNRRRAIRLVIEGPSRSCDNPLEELQDHWATTWAERAADTALLFERPAAPQPVDTSPSPPTRSLSACARPRIPHRDPTDLPTIIGSSWTRRRDSSRPCSTLACTNAGRLAHVPYRAYL
ncbi:hypothetical protein MTO96_034294 [Rhipicephalus appendiculatus]